MLYQLPNGKTINLTTDEFLSMTDADIQDMIATGKGFYSNPRKTSFTYDDVEEQEPEFIDSAFINCEEDEEINPKQLKEYLDNLPEED